MQLRYRTIRTNREGKVIKPKLLVSAVLAFSTFVCAFSCNSANQNKFQAPTAQVTAGKVSIIESAISEIKQCKSIVDLKKHLGNFSNYLEQAIKEKDSTGLRTLYESIEDKHILDQIMEIDWAQNPGRYYKDYLNVLGQLFSNAQSQREKLAIIFLVLPRFYNRELTMDVIDKTEQMGSTIEKVRLESEEEFILLISKDPELARVADLVKKYWYKEDKTMPSEADKEAFFKELCAFY